MPSVSFSEIKVARRCPKAWEYKYVQQLARRRPSRPALVGTILHEMIDAYNKAKLIHTYDNDPWKVLEHYEKQYQKLFAEEREEYGDIPALASEIFLGYMRRWRRDGLKRIASEIPIITDLTSTLRFIGIIDEVVEDEKGRRFVVDHKFHKRIPGPDERFADIQTLLYIWAWNREHSRDQQVDGVIWDYGRMKAPTPPELLKRGGLTKRKNIDCDPHTYLREIKKHGFDPKDYKDILRELEGKETTFFERVILPAPSKRMIEEVVEDARTTAIVRKTLGTIAPRHMSGFNCRGCEFRNLCEAEIRGLDSEFVKKRDYELRENPREEFDDGYEDAA